MGHVAGVGTSNLVGPVVVADRVLSAVIRECTGRRGCPRQCCGQCTVADCEPTASSQCDQSHRRNSPSKPDECRTRGINLGGQTDGDKQGRSRGHPPLVSGAGRCVRPRKCRPRCRRRGCEQATGGRCEQTNGRRESRTLSSESCNGGISHREQRRRARQVGSAWCGAFTYCPEDHSTLGEK